MIFGFFQSRSGGIFSPYPGRFKATAVYLGKPDRYKISVADRISVGLICDCRSFVLACSGGLRDVYLDKLIDN